MDGTLPSIFPDHLCVPLGPDASRGWSVPAPTLLVMHDRADAAFIALTLRARRFGRRSCR